MRALRLNRHDADQNGFIPMIICLILIIVAVLYFSYKHVSQAQQ